MKPFALALIASLCLTAPAGAADMSLADLVGRWAGTGTYHEATSKARMQCRLTVTGDAAQVSFAGRCGSSMGAHDVVLHFTGQGNGQIEVVAGEGASGVETKIDKLTGRIDGQQLTVNGAAGVESAKMQFALMADGTVRFVAERKWATGRSHSTVVLRER